VTIRFFAAALCAVLPLRPADPFPESQTAESIYGFSTAKYDIRMRVSFPAPYEAKRLSVYHAADPVKEDCLSVATDASGCIDSFVGALAVVSFAVTQADNGKPAAASIREMVAVVEQSPGLPSRPPFAMTVKLTDGIGSDLQAFGYDEGHLPAVGRAAEREAAKAAWRRYRQELYLDKDRQPFAVIEWLHTITRIRILSVDAPPFPRASRSDGGRLRLVEGKEPGRNRASSRGLPLKDPVHWWIKPVNNSGFGGKSYSMTTMAHRNNAAAGWGFEYQ
jgi:hypothetical protein